MICSYRLHGGIACKAACDAYMHGELGDTFIEDEITDAQVCIGLREAQSLVVAFRYVYVDRLDI
jgi:hypothetical protein